MENEDSFHKHKAKRYVLTGMYFAGMKFPTTHIAMPEWDSYGLL
jgi:hypothetical protein